MGRSFVATPISLLRTFCQILLTKCPGLALTVRKRIHEGLELSGSGL